MALQLHIVTHSEVGPVRKNNQDSGYASPNLLVVADGMGGAAAGDLASAVAIDTIRRIDGPADADHMLEVLAGALHKANDRIADLVDADYALEGMGTTVTGVLFDGAHFGLAHIGDSRAYLMHDGRLERLTHDHSWVQSLVDDGKISEREAAIHPHRSLLLKVLNGQPANDPDLTMVTVVPGDRLMLCSDGLCGLVDDPVIEAAMRHPDIEVALRQLVDEALDEGGIDNITVIVADVVDSSPAEAAVVLGAAAERAIPAVETRLRSTTTAIGDVAAVDPAAVGADDEADEAEPTDRDGSPAPQTSAAGQAGLATDPDDEIDDEIRYSPQAPPRRRFVRPLVGVLVLVLVLGAGLSAAYAWTRTQYYVGASNNNVAIFQGLSESLPGLPLSRLYEAQTLTVSALPPYYQDRVRASIDVGSLAAARQTVKELSDAAQRCRVLTPTTPPTASASASTSRSAAPTVASTRPGSVTTSKLTPSLPVSPSVAQTLKPNPSSTPRPGATPTTSGSATAAPNC